MDLNGGMMKMSGIVFDRLHASFTISLIQWKCGYHYLYWIYVDMLFLLLYFLVLFVILNGWKDGKESLSFLAFWGCLSFNWTRTVHLRWSM